MLDRFQVIMRPNRAEALCRRLVEEEGLVTELSVVEVRGYGRQHGQRASRGDLTIEYLPKVVVIGYIEPESRAHFIELVLGICRTGRIGDGKITFQPCERMIRF